MLKGKISRADRGRGLVQQLDLLTFGDSKKHIRTPVSFRFVDLFAGIGGFRFGLESLGGQCVFSCEWDKHSQQTYEAWFGEKPHGDIRSINPDIIPDHEILAAGFPCQPFSIAGVSKKKSLGREHGFLDETQGTLFFHIAEIARRKRPHLIMNSLGCSYHTSERYLW